MAKDPALGIRLEPDERDALDRASKADERALSAMGRKIIVEWLRSNGWMPERRQVPREAKTIRRHCRRRQRQRSRPRGRRGRSGGSFSSPPTEGGVTGRSAVGAGHPLYVSRAFGVQHAAEDEEVIG